MSGVDFEKIRLSMQVGRLERERDGLLDAVERLNETIERLERENAFLRHYAPDDIEPSAPQAEGRAQNDGRIVVASDEETA